MHRPLRIHPISRAAGLAALALCAAPAATADTLVVNGKTASTDVRTVGGSAYVKLSDMAKSLGMIIVKRPGGYELTKAGGTDQVQAVTHGKVGDVLFDGQWRFQVKAVETPDSYIMKTPGVQGLLRGISTIDNDENSRTVRAAPGYKLVVIQCRVTNGQKFPQTFWLGHSDVRNALTDTQGESYPPVGYDLEGAPTESKSLLPGAGTSCPILFSVPEATHFKDLIFTLRDNRFSSNAKVSDVRVSLIP